MEDEKEEIYELTAQILVLGYSPEDARERANRQVVIDDLLGGPVLLDWSHRSGPIDPQQTIDRLTRKIKQRER